MSKSNDFRGLLPRKQWVCCWKLACSESVHGKELPFNLHCLTNLFWLLLYHSVNCNSLASLELAWVWQFATQTIEAGGFPKGINKSLQQLESVNWKKKAALLEKDAMMAIVAINKEKRLVSKRNGRGHLLQDLYWVMKWAWTSQKIVWKGEHEAVCWKHQQHWCVGTKKDECQETPRRNKRGSASCGSTAWVWMEKQQGFLAACWECYCPCRYLS